MSWPINIFNCFLLELPILLWNLLFYRFLPQYLFNDTEVSKKLLSLEDFLRFLIFSLPLFIPIVGTSPYAMLGYVVYTLGTLIYFASWIPHLKRGVKGPVLFLGPFVTPVLFLSGISLIGGDLLYEVLVLIFVAVHTYHGTLNLKAFVVE